MCYMGTVADADTDTGLVNTLWLCEVHGFSLRHFLESNDPICKRKVQSFFHFFFFWPQDIRNTVVKLELSEEPMAVGP